MKKKDKQVFVGDFIRKTFSDANLDIELFSSKNLGEHIIDFKVGERNVTLYIKDKELKDSEISDIKVFCDLDNSVDYILFLSVNGCYLLEFYKDNVNKITPLEIAGFEFKESLQRSLLRVINVIKERESFKEEYEKTNGVKWSAEKRDCWFIQINGYLIKETLC